MKFKPFLLAFLFPVLAVIGASTCAFADKRVALVIGNSTYRTAPALPNPVNDADELAAALKRVGFTVLLQRDLDKRGMEAAIAQFARLSQDADAALFYYAGHGTQHRGTNYLVPVDASLDDEFRLNFELTRLDDVLFGLERARGVKILVLDACRNNPLLDRLNRTSPTRDLVATRGLTKVEATRGMVIAFSTQINQVAVDGTGRNSPFASALVKEIDEPGIEIGTLFRRVAKEVYRATEQRQLPELSISLLGEFYLNARDTDMQAWSKIRQSDDPAVFSKFIIEYPKSALSVDARDRLAAIDKQQRAKVERERLERERIAREQAEQRRREEGRIAREEAEKQAAERRRREEADKQSGAEQPLPPSRIEPETPGATGRPPPVDLAGPTPPARPAPDQQFAARPPDTAPTQPRATETPDDDKRPQAPFDGGWTVTWTGGRNCLLKSGTFAIEVRNGVITGRGSGRISTTGAAQWSSTSRFGDRVSHVGRFSGDAGKGRFQNVKGCQGTFVAGRHSEPAIDEGKVLSQEPPMGKCSSREIERDGRCVAKSCPSGKKVGPDGKCTPVVENRPSRRTSAAPPSRGRCFTFAGKTYCE